jgi:hypothetical protein
MAASDTCREIGDDGGYSGDHGPIPAAGKKRRTRRCFSAPQRSAGRHGTSAMDGGELGSLRRVLGRETEREREPGREERKRGFQVRWGFSRVFSSARGAGGGKQEVASGSSWELHAPACSWRKRMTCILHKTPWFLGFSGNLKTTQVLVQFNTLYLFKTSENFGGFSAK